MNHVIFEHLFYLKYNKKEINLKKNTLIKNQVHIPKDFLSKLYTAYY
jgi:hypothetical protein